MTCCIPQQVILYLVEMGAYDSPVPKVPPEVTTSLVCVLSFAYRPSTDGVAIRYPASLRPFSTGVGTVAPWFVSLGSHHPGLGEPNVTA